jgi:hypothetical protein
VKDDLSAKMGRSEPSVSGPKEMGTPVGLGMGGFGGRPPKSPGERQGSIKKTESLNNFDQPGSKLSTPKKR